MITLDFGVVSSNSISFTVLPFGPLTWLSRQVSFAAITPGDGVVEFTLLGRVGQLPYARWGRELAKDFTALPGTGRLLLWGGTALWALWEEKIRPFAAGLWH